MKPEQLQYQLSRAAGNGDVEKVRLLVAQGANLKHRDPWGANSLDRSGSLSQVSIASPSSARLSNSDRWWTHRTVRGSRR